MKASFTLTTETRALWDAWHTQAVPEPGSDPAPVPEPTRPGVMTLLESLPDVDTDAGDRGLQLQQLRAALLGAIADDVRPSSAATESEDAASPRWLKWSKLGMVALAGIVLAVAEGAEIIMDIAGGLGMASGFSGGLLAGALVLGIGMAVAFCAMDFYEIATALNIRFGQVTRWMDAYVEQTRQIDIIRQAIANPSRSVFTGSQDDREYRLQIADMLYERYRYMNTVRTAYTERQKSIGLQVAKTLVTVVAGTTMFTAGFAMGMSLISLMIATPPLGALLGAGAFFGLLAVAIYWGFRRSEAENGVARIFGFDREKIEKVCENAEEKEQELINLAENLRESTPVVSSPEVSLQEESTEQSSPLSMKPAAPSGAVVDSGTARDNALLQTLTQEDRQRLLLRLQQMHAQDLGVAQDLGAAVSPGRSNDAFFAHSPASSGRPVPASSIPVLLPGSEEVSSSLTASSTS